MLLGILDMAVYRVKKLIAWVLAIGIIGLILAGAYWVVTL